jgi:hypothetical protein
MMFCHLGKAQSLRDICDGLRSMEGKLSHLGIDSPKRSTLAYTNEHRPWQMYRDVFGGCTNVAGIPRRVTGSGSRTSCTRSTPPRSRSVRACSTGHVTRARRELRSSIWYSITTGVTLRRLRLVTLIDRDGKIFDFLANIFHLSAATIGEIYRDRWNIEKFFRAIKQNLRIKTFVGTTENSLQIQIWTALIAMFLLRYVMLRSTYGWSLSNFVAMLRHHLFSYRDLTAWLADPSQTSPTILSFNYYNLDSSPAQRASSPVSLPPTTLTTAACFTLQLIWTALVGRHFLSRRSRPDGQLPSNNDLL